jgi:hypothetical protein
LALTILLRFRRHGTAVAVAEVLAGRTVHGRMPLHPNRPRSGCTPTSRRRCRPAIRRRPTARWATRQQPDKAGELNLNLWTGIGMLVFTGLLVLWLRLRPEG